MALLADVPVEDLEGVCVDSASQVPSTMCLATYRIVPSRPARSVFSSVYLVATLLI
jgi:hypothetical protein